MRDDYAIAFHFCGARDCWWQRATFVRGFLISSVGDYHPRSFLGRQEIGPGRLYETMVFEVEDSDRLCPCGCGAPHGDRIQYCDLRMEPAQNAIDANLNHERLVREHESKLAAQSRRDCIREPREQPFGHVSEDYQP